jgi:hypothetical protein
MVSSIVDKLKCFNDQNFKFDPKWHKYTYNGKQYTSVTKFIEKFHKPFDQEYWSKRKSEELGVEQKDLLKQWQDKNDYANLVGHTTHDWIEGYFNREFKELPTNIDIIGRINKFLEELNMYPNWRKLLGKEIPDLRMRDIEMILRFFSLLENWQNYKKPMKDFIEDYMDKYKDLTKEKEMVLSKIFKGTIDIIYNEIGERAFRLRAINVSIFDSLAVALALLGDKRAQNLKESYSRLIDRENKSYFASVQKSTTDTDRVQGRIKMALETLSK